MVLFIFFNKRRGIFFVFFVGSGEDVLGSFSVSCVLVARVILGVIFRCLFVSGYGT